MKMHQFFLIVVLFGLPFIMEVKSFKIMKNRETRNCRRFLDTKIAVVCSQKTDPMKDPPAESPTCGNETVIEVVAVYVGLKSPNTGVCPDNENKTSKYAHRCCTLEQNDTLIDINDIKDQPEKHDVKRLLKNATNHCNGRKNCSIPSVVVRVVNGLLWRNYSNFIVVEYRCSYDRQIETSIIEQDSSLQSKTALTCSYKVSLNQNVTDEELVCGTEMLINVTNVFIGLKSSTITCPDGDNSATGYDLKCCEYEHRDFIFDAYCLRDQQSSNVSSYVEVMKNVEACTGKKKCSIPSLKLPSKENLRNRTYSNYILVEYTCTASDSPAGVSYTTREQIHSSSTDGYGESSTITYEDVKDVSPGVQTTTIVIIVGGVLLAVALLTGIIWMRKRLTRDTADDHVNLERRLDNPRPATETGYEEMPLADQGVCNEADQQWKGTKVDDTYDHAVVRGSCLASVKEKPSDLNDTYDHTVVGSGSASMKEKTTDADDTYDHAVVASGNVSTTGKTTDADDPYDHTVVGSGSASMKEKTTDADDTYDHAVVASGNVSTTGKTTDADDPYDHTVVGSGSASIKEKTTDADDTYDHTVVGSGSASIKEKTTDADDTYDHTVVGSGSASIKEKTTDADDTYDHTVVESGSASIKEKTTDADDTYDHTVVESGSASIKEKTTDADDTYDHTVVANGNDSTTGMKGINGSA